MYNSNDLLLIFGIFADIHKHSGGVCVVEAIQHHRGDLGIKGRLLIRCYWPRNGVVCSRILEGQPTSFAQA